MRFSDVPLDIFNEIVFNAGILLFDFDITNGTYKREDLVGATSGGLNFSATFDTIDLGEDIDGCPKGTMEMMQIQNWNINCSGTFKSTTDKLIKESLAAADIKEIDENKSEITLRKDLKTTDFFNRWMLCDYGRKDGFIAIHIWNALNTNGYSIKTGDGEKGSSDFNYKGHFSVENVSKVPCKIYLVKTGKAPSTPETPDSGTETQQSNEATTFKATRSKLNTTEV